MTDETIDPGLQRWRLVLGEAGGLLLGGGEMSRTIAARDAALDWLYGRDEDLSRRAVRRGGTRSAGTRKGGTETSVLTTVDWLDQIFQLFPKETIERLERDAVERYELHDVVTDPAVLERIEPNPTLLKAVLRTKHLMDPQVLVLARRIVAAVLEQLMAKLDAQVRQAFSGTRARRPSLLRQARNFDIRRTIAANLAHYDPEQRRIYLQRPHFFTRTRRHIDRWQVILLVDQSGSMAGSVIHSAIIAACLWGLPGVRTHLVAFDTTVVDLSNDVGDPVELLMKVQLGGGTDIGQAVDYAAGLVENPRRTIVALITDFYEGGNQSHLVRSVGQLVEQGARVLGLAALDEEANPDFDRDLAQRLANVGAFVGAMTPGELASFVAGAVGR